MVRVEGVTDGTLEIVQCKGETRVINVDLLLLNPDPIESPTKVELG